MDIFFHKFDVKNGFILWARCWRRQRFCLPLETISTGDRSSSRGITNFIERVALLLPSGLAVAGPDCFGLSYSLSTAAVADAGPAGGCFAALFCLTLEF